MKSDNIVNFKFSKNLINYDDSMEFMSNHINNIRNNNANELLWFLEHYSVYTAGTSAKKEDQQIINKSEIRYVGRGGQWTWHGPGQRVVYIMLDLKKRKKDIREFIHCLEKWIVSTLNYFSLSVVTREKYPGVWLKKNNVFYKIASIGIRISDWVTWHGISINIDPNLNYFNQIVPCGVKNSYVTSLKDQNIIISKKDFDCKLQENFYLFF